MMQETRKRTISLFKRDQEMKERQKPWERKEEFEDRPLSQVISLESFHPLSLFLSFLPLLTLLLDLLLMFLSFMDKHPSLKHLSLDVEQTEEFAKKSEVLLYPRVEGPLTSRLCYFFTVHFITCFIFWTQVVLRFFSREYPFFIFINYSSDNRQEKRSCEGHQIPHK